MAPCPHAQKLPLAVVIALEPVGVVVGGRTEPIDDDWGGVHAVIRLDGAQFGADAVASGRPASSRSRARWTSHAVSSPPSRRYGEATGQAHFKERSL